MYSTFIPLQYGMAIPLCCKYTQIVHSCPFSSIRQKRQFALVAGLFIFSLYAEVTRMYTDEQRQQKQTSRKCLFPSIQFCLTKKMIHYSFFICMRRPVVYTLMNRDSGHNELAGGVQCLRRCYAPCYTKIQQQNGTERSGAVHSVFRITDIFLRTTVHVCAHNCTIYIQMYMYNVCVQLCSKLHTHQGIFVVCSVFKTFNMILIDGTLIYHFTYLVVIRYKCM